MSKISILLLLAVAAFAQDAPVPMSWKLSVAAMATAQAADHLSSRGRLELNPMLRGSDGTYSEAKGIAVKAGLVAGLALTERLMMRHHPKLAKPFTWINVAIAGSSGAVAVRNWGGR